MLRAVAAAITAMVLVSCGRSGTPAPQAQQSAVKPPAEPAQTAAPVADSVAPASSFTFKPCTLPKGTEIDVKLLSVADSSVTTEGFLPGTVTSDVKAADGSVAIPAYSPAVIVVRESRKSGPISRMVFGLYSVRIGDREHSLSDGAKEPAYLTFSEDAGKGAAHSAVHLQFGANLGFRLESPIQLR